MMPHVPRSRLSHEAPESIPPHDAPELYIPHPTDKYPSVFDLHHQYQGADSPQILYLHHPDSGSEPVVTRTKDAEKGAGVSQGFQDAVVVVCAVDAAAECGRGCGRCGRSVSDEEEAESDWGEAKRAP